jgi:DNA-binding MarR family transcriptional regulator
VEKQINIIEPRFGEPFIDSRYDPESEDVKENPDNYEIKECDTCGRKFAELVWESKYHRNCCSVCSFDWKNLSKKRNDAVMRLFYFRVKVPRDLNSCDIGDLYYKDFSRTDLDVLSMIRYNDGLTATDIVNRLYGVKFTVTGMVSKRSTVVERCQKLIKLGLIRKYNAKGDGRPGRRKVKYKLNHKIVTLYKECPSCGNYNYSILEKSKKIQCINCSLKWEIPK